MSGVEKFQVPEIDRVTEVFPANALSWMPEYQDIPQEFRDDSTEWNDIAHQWFYKGLADDVEFYPQEGVDAEKAYRALAATLRSFAPKHEHKMAAVAYMMSCWFVSVKKWEIKKEK